MKIDWLSLLTLIVALSAYISALRFTMLGKLAEWPRPRNQRSLKKNLFFLMPIDFFLVFSGVFVAIHLFVGWWFDCERTLLPRQNWETPQLCWGGISSLTIRGVSR